MSVQYETLGQGPTVILTPGWMMTRQVWARQAPLAEHFRLVLWDLPETGPNQSPLRLEHCALALHELLEKLADETVIYVGWSMGMSVFWKYLEQYGEGPIKQVVNVEMVPKMDPKATMVDAVEKAMKRDRRHATEKFLRRALHHVDETDLARFVDAACALPLDSVLSVYRDMAASDLSPVAAACTGALHLAFGRQGFYASHEVQLRQFFPGQTIQWFEHSAHAPFWEEAEAFNHWLMNVLGHRAQ